MGRNLVLNIADHGTSVAVHNRTRSRLDDFIASPDAQARAIIGCATPGDLAAALEHPRAILLMVKAGRAVDDQIDALRPHLEPGDLIIDGGNAPLRRHRAPRRDPGRRRAAVSRRRYFGRRGGVRAMARRSWSAATARPTTWSLRCCAPIAADVGGNPCCAWFEPGGAGHFVKMVHNGIEYAVMQAIGEIWVMMRDLFRFDAEAAANTFSIWADGPLGSYLIEITANILATRDAETGRALVTMIADRAGHKGTGRWTGEAALALDVPAPTLIAGYLARCLSADGEARHEARLASPTSVDSYNGDRRQAAVGENGRGAAGDQCDRLCRRLPIAQGGVGRTSLGPRSRRGGRGVARRLYRARPPARGYRGGVSRRARLGAIERGAWIGGNSRRDRGRLGGAPSRPRCRRKFRSPRYPRRSPRTTAIERRRCGPAWCRRSATTSAPTPISGPTATATFTPIGRRVMAADRAGPTVIIVMGVAGSGKTTVGRLLADALDAAVCRGR